MWPNLQETADFVTFTEKNLNGKLQFLCSDFVKFTCIGKRHLSFVIKSDDFKTKYVSEKIANWIQEIFTLRGYAKTYTHGAYATCRRVVHQSTNSIRTIQWISDYLKLLHDLIKNVFLSTLLDSVITDDDHFLFSLPVLSLYYQEDIWTILKAH